MAVDPILSNRLYLDLMAETVWGDAGAGPIVAATQLALNGVVDGTPMVGLIQPKGSRKLRITITDANISINAFSITIVGLDRFGAALTQTFLFAGGLVQTSAAYYASITSITVDSIVAESAGDTLDADWMDALPLLIPVKEGDYGVALDDPSREQEHIVGDSDAQYMVHSARRLGGPLKVGVWPHLWATLLGWAIDRNTSNEVASKTARFSYPGIETVEHLGLKVDKIGIEGASEGDLDLSLDLVGWYEKPHAGGVLNYPGTAGADPDHAAYEVPEIASIEFLNLAFVASFNSGGVGAFSNRLKPKGVQNVSLTYENNIRSGPPVENRFDVKKNAAVEFLVTGRKRLTFRYTIVFDRVEIAELQRDRKYTQLKIMGSHPGYTTYATVTADAAAGAAVNVAVDSSAGFTVGHYVLFDAYGGTTLKCVGKITAKADGTHMTIDILDENIKSGDHVFMGAFEILTAPAIVPSSPKNKAFNEFVTAEINCDVFSGKDALLSYKALDLALP